MQNTQLKEDTDVPKANDMIRNLIEDHETIICFIRNIFSMIEQGNDQATIDLLTQRLNVHEKTSWMLRSLLE